MDDERKEKIKSVDTLGNNKYRYTEQVKNSDGNFEKVEDFKFEVFSTPSLSASRESLIEETIKMSLNLKPHDKIRIIEDEDNKE